MQSLLAKKWHEIPLNLTVFGHLGPASWLTKEGVESIGAFLYHSKTMLVLWDPSYVRMLSSWDRQRA